MAAMASRATPATTSCGSSYASRSAMRCQRARMRHGLGPGAAGEAVEVPRGVDGGVM